MVSEKQIVGERAATYVEDGMIVGLGTGSTAYFFVKGLAKRIQAEGLHITGVPTSIATAELAKESGITVKNIDEVSHIDLTVDGTDEFDPQLNGIKGGGGALLIEKIVAMNSSRVIWIADHSKKVQQLGAFPLPVEVITEGSTQLLKQFEAKGYQPTLRLAADGYPYLTDHQHYIIDLHLEKIANAEALAEELIHMVGVVEHGLFLNIAEMVILADGEQWEDVHKK